MSVTKLLLVVMLFIVALLVPSDHVAAGSAAPAEGEADSYTADAETLEAFVDKYVAEHMADAKAPGMVITVVVDGKVALSKGYGFADLESGKPFTPRTTLRAGSVSKPVTSALVLRYVESGRLALNEPLSTYIDDLPLEDSYGTASTVAELLTLRGGYADKVLLSHSVTLEKWQPLDRYLADNLPPRSVRPGTVYSYSSWDHALLGYAMEKISGKPFDQVATEELFSVLGMTSTTFTQPLPEAIRAELAQGYYFHNGDYEEVPLDFVNLTPGIALVTTAEDMSRFMVALLNDGVLDGRTVFSPETIEGMLTRQDAPHPFSRARSFGLSEINFDDRPALYHNGNGIGFSSRIVLIPEHKFGIFISTNHRDIEGDISRTPAARFTHELSEAIIVENIPATATEYPAGTPLEDAADRASRYAGHYRLAETPMHDFFKISGLMDYADVRDSGDGKIAIGSRKYVEVEPLVFRTEEAPYYYIFFTEDEAGKVEYVAFGGTGTYARVAWYESFMAQAMLAGLMLLVFLSMAVVWPFRPAGHWSIWALSLLNLIFLVGFTTMLMQADLMRFFKEIPLTTRAILTLPWLSLIMTLVAAIALVKGWNGLDRVAFKIHAVVTMSASVAFLGFASYWKLFL